MTAKQAYDACKATSLKHPEFPSSMDEFENIPPRVQSWWETFVQHLNDLSYESHKEGTAGNNV